ncbi:alkaline phosphatase [Palleronia marisminoris]|uniref:Alkaline phosphatase H n=1 Tax=Palleronia marisminoris TaxID=315423 RepID=A0A1Y5RB89_9RHOB|nr:alkaline phosphatase [Palleronia marisminoris]SFG10586.1 alkaline phosphatase [Palleronia marisminoris]SLN13349.1 Alkaline phosphatase H precursor [Palleronia marisminoris]
MKLRVTLAVLGMTASVASAQEAVPQASNQWFADAQAKLEEMLQREQITGRARNVILFVADGNGVATNYATRVFTGQQDGGYGDEYVQPHEDFPYLALVKTYTTNGLTPDSAPTAAAFNSGVKAKNDVINVTDAVNVGDCAAGAEDEVALLSEIVSDAGKSVGIVSTARITHATGAAVYARTVSRDYEDDTLVPEGCDQPDIAAQLASQMNDGVIDVVFSGGRRHFLPDGETDAEGEAGSRGDGRNLIEEITGEDGTYVQTQEEFQEIDTSGVEGPILGLFEGSHMLYEADRANEPSLAEMTEAAIEVLSRDEDGYYLMVEGGRVDHANHAGNLARTVRDGRAFAEAIALADEMTEDSETLIVVTADHDHALQFNGYCGRGSDILGLCMGVNPDGIEHTGEPNLASDELPYTVAGYLNGVGSVLIEQVEVDDADISQPVDPDTGAAAGDPRPLYQGSRPMVTQEEATDLDYIQQALIPMPSETHSGTDVALYAKGPWAHLFDGTIEQNVIFHVMRYATMEAEEE